MHWSALPASGNSFLEGLAIDHKVMLVVAELSTFDITVSVTADKGPKLHFLCRFWDGNGDRLSFGIVVFIELAPFEQRN